MGPGQILFLILLGSQQCGVILLLSLIVFFSFFPNPLPHFISNFCKNVLEETELTGGRRASLIFCPFSQLKNYLHAHLAFPPIQMEQESGISTPSHIYASAIPLRWPPKPVYSTVKSSYLQPPPWLCTS